MEKVESITTLNEDEDDSDTEGEDIVQTIITRTKRVRRVLLLPLNEESV